MSDLKNKLDEFEKLTTELTPEEARRLVEEATGQREKDTVPEIPVEYLLAREQEKSAQSSASETAEGHGASPRNSPPPQRPPSEAKTEPGVYIKVGKEKMVWVEGEKKENDPDNGSGKIFG